MKPRTKEKLYIYYRENKKCFYCKKDLLFKQISIDHFYPLSLGGTHDVFNIVCSCKKCNKIKENDLPEKAFDTLVKLFKKAVKDDFITGNNLDVSNKELKELLLKVNKVKSISGEFIFESSNYRFYIKDNQVYKYNYVNTKM